MDDQIFDEVMQRANAAGADVRPVVERHLQAAAAKLSPPDTILMLMHIVAGMMSAAATFGLQHRRDSVEADELFDQTLEHLNKIAAYHKPTAIAAAEALRAGTYVD